MARESYQITYSFGPFINGADDELLADALSEASDGTCLYYCLSGISYVDFEIDAVGPCNAIIKARNLLSNSGALKMVEYAELETLRKWPVI